VIQISDLNSSEDSITSYSSIVADIETGETSISHKSSEMLRIAVGFSTSLELPVSGGGIEFNTEMARELTVTNGETNTHQSFNLFLFSISNR
jgi:hypothetical protein